MSQTIQLKRDTSANWTTANTLLKQGEVGLETDTKKAKFGDGVTNWNSLGYAFGGTSTGDIFGPGSSVNDNFAVFNGVTGKLLKDSGIAPSSKENTITAGTTAQYYRGDKSWQTLDKTSVGLANVDNTSDSTKNSATSIITNKTFTTGNIYTANINAQSGTTYTFVLTDQSKLVTFTNASAISVTIPTNASVAFPVGTQIDCSQDGAGKVTFSGGGVTINSLSSLKSLAGQYVGGTLIKTATDTWTLYGNLIA